MVQSLKKLYIPPIFWFTFWSVQPKQLVVQKLCIIYIDWSPNMWLLWAKKAKGYSYLSNKRRATFINFDFFIQGYFLIRQATFINFHNFFQGLLHKYLNNVFSQIYAVSLIVLHWKITLDLNFFNFSHSGCLGSYLGSENLVKGGYVYQILRNYVSKATFIKGATFINSREIIQGYVY